MNSSKTFRPAVWLICVWILFQAAFVTVWADDEVAGGLERGISGNASQSSRNPFADIRAEDLTGITFERGSSALSCTVTDREKLARIVDVLHTIPLKDADFTVEDAGTHYAVTRADQKFTTTFQLELLNRICFTDSDQQTTYAYIGPYAVFYNDRYDDIFDGYASVDFYDRLDAILTGEAVEMDWKQGKWPERLYSKSGSRQVDNVVVGVGNLAYKTVTKPQDLQELLDNVFAMHLTCGDQFLTPNPMTTDRSNRYFVATFMTPNTERYPMGEAPREFPVIFPQVYAISLRDGTYYLSYYDYLELPIRTEDAEALVRCIKGMDYPLQSDERYPHWWRKNLQGW